MIPSTQSGALMRLVALIQSKDWNRPSEVLALELIYAYNLWKCPVDKIEFGKPVVCDPRPDITDDPNTFVPTVIDPEYDSRFEGQNGFMYRRLPIEIIGPDRGPEIRPKQFPFYAWDEIDAINEFMGLQLRKEDILNIKYEDNQTDYNLYLSDSALVWLPGVISLNVGPPGPRDMLVQNAELSGFKQWAP